MKILYKTLDVKNKLENLSDDALYLISLPIHLKEFISGNISSSINPLLLLTEYWFFSK